MALWLLIGLKLTVKEESVGVKGNLIIQQTLNEYTSCEISVLEAVGTGLGTRRRRMNRVSMEMMKII